MNEIRRIPEPYKRRIHEGITSRDKNAILEEYEIGMAKGENRDQLLQDLMAKYFRGDRQIERYIAQARESKDKKPGDEVVEDMSLGD